MRQLPVARTRSGGAQVWMHRRRGRRGLVAQRPEQLLYTENAGGSTPSRSTLSIGWLVSHYQLIRAGRHGRSPLQTCPNFEGIDPLQSEGGKR